MLQPDSNTNTGPPADDSAAIAGLSGIPGVLAGSDPSSIATSPASWLVDKKEIPGAAGPDPTDDPETDR